MTLPQDFDLQTRPLEVAGWNRRSLIALDEIVRSVARAFDFEFSELKGRWIGHEAARVRGFIFALAYDLFDVPTRRLSDRFDLTPGGVRASIRRARFVLSTEPRQRRRLQSCVEELEIGWMPRH